MSYVVHAEVEFTNGHKKSFLDVRDIAWVADQQKNPVALNISYASGQHFTSIPSAAIRNMRVIPIAEKGRIKMINQITGAVIEHG